MESGTATGRRPGASPGAWLELLRPVTLAPLVLISVLFGLVGAGGWPGTDGFLRILLAGALLTVLNGASNIWNQLSDQTEDGAHATKSRRPIVSGRIDPTVALSVSVLTLLGSVAAAALFLSPTFLILYVTVAFFAWTYSFWPRLKARFGWNAGWLGTPRGGVGIAAAWCVFGSLLDPRLWAVLLVTVPFVTLANESRNIADRDADAFAGVRTLAVVYGAGASRAATVAGFLWPLVAGVALWPRFPDPWLFLWAAPAAVGAWASVRWPGARAWTLFYGLYGVLCLVLTVPSLV